MTIGLLGGAFNPPHLGHVYIAKQCLEVGGFDEVWFVPNFKQSPPKPVASAKDRLAMTRCISLDHTRVSTIEIDHELNGQTISLLPYLPTEHSYEFIIGSDQLATFNQWGNYKELLQKMPFLVFPRFGYSTEPLYDNMRVLSHPGLNALHISSSSIRDRVKQGLSIVEFVPHGVAEYIQRKKLYI